MFLQSWESILAILITIAILATIAERLSELLSSLWRDLFFAEVSEKTEPRLVVEAARRRGLDVSAAYAPMGVFRMSVESVQRARDEMNRLSPEERGQETEKARRKIRSYRVHWLVLSLGVLIAIIFQVRVFRALGLDPSQDMVPAVEVVAKKAADLSLETPIEGRSGPVRAIITQTELITLPVTGTSATATQEGAPVMSTTERVTTTVVQALLDTDEAPPRGLPLGALIIPWAWLDIVLSGLVIGGGSEPIHQLIKRLALVRGGAAEAAPTPAIPSNPSVAAIDPTSGPNTTAALAVTVSGSRFWRGLHLRLEAEGREPIEATNVEVRSPTTLRGELPLEGKERGSWRVVVEDAQFRRSSEDVRFEIT